MKSVGLMCVFVVIAAVLGGCFAPPVMLASAGLSAAQEGATAYARGRLSTAHPAPLPAVWDATIDALEDYEFTIRRQRVSDRLGYVIARDLSDRKITIELHARTPRVTKVRIRVGFWGDPAISRLIMDGITSRLMRMDIFGPDPNEW